MTIETDEQFIQRLTRVNYELMHERDEVQMMLDSALEQLRQCGERCEQLEQALDASARAIAQDATRDMHRRIKSAGADDSADTD